MENAIERTFKLSGVIERYGEKVPELCASMVRNHPLDCEKDQPIPQWALDIMKDKTVGYRTRIRIVMTHHFDITGESPSWRFVPPKSMKEAPPRDPPKSLVALREKNRQKAEEYLKSKGEDKQ